MERMRNRIGRIDRRSWRRSSLGRRLVWIYGILQETPIEKQQARAALGHMPTLISETRLQISSPGLSVRYDAIPL